MASLKGIKELYDFKIKTSSQMERNGKTLEVGETIAFFERIQVSSLELLEVLSQATGGYRNSSLVVWQSPKEVGVSFSQGVFNKDMLSILLKSDYLTKVANTVLVPMTEKRESDENSQVKLKHIPNSNLYVRSLDTGDKITYSLNGDIITIGSPYTDLLIEYDFLYNGDSIEYKIGEEFYSGFVSLEAKMRVKDDEGGHTNTGILRIPKFKILSDLSITVGQNRPPFLGTFQGIGYPTGRRGDAIVAELTFLDDDIDAEI